MLEITERKLSDRLIFENSDSDILITVIENNDVPKVLDDLLQYIDQHADNNNPDYEPVLHEMILEYCNEKYYSVDAIADVISSDDDFKELLYNNCKRFNILRDVE